MDRSGSSHSSGTVASSIGKPQGRGFVEIGLLLPSHRADALLALSRERHQTVAQILRDLIDRALSETARA